jgi:hypothetical protein
MLNSLLTEVPEHGLGGQQHAQTNRTLSHNDFGAAFLGARQFNA